MFIVKCILTEAFSPVNNFLMFIIKFYMFYNEFYTFYNKTQTNCNPWHPIPSPTKKAAALTDNTARVQMLHQAEDMLMDTWAAVPIYFYNDDYMCKTNVTGIYNTKFGTKYFMYATIE